MEAFLEFLRSPWGIVLFTVVAVAIVLFFLAANYRLFTKAVLDFIFGIVAIIVLSPSIIASAIILKVKTGSVLQKHWIAGKGGKPVCVYTFIECEQNGRPCYINRSVINYFPLLFGVICGRLSLLGPLPVSLRDAALTGDEYDLRFAVRPGIISPALKHFGEFPEWEEMFAYECGYVKSRGLFRDAATGLVILLRAVRGEGARLLDFNRAGYADELLRSGKITEEQIEEAEKIAEDEMLSVTRLKNRVG